MFRTVSASTLTVFFAGVPRWKMEELLRMALILRAFVMVEFLTLTATSPAPIRLMTEELPSLFVLLRLLTMVEFSMLIVHGEDAWKYPMTGSVPPFVLIVEF